MHRSVWCVYLLVGAAAAHGYLSWPEARQYKCFRDNHFWWPQNGDDIPDRACRDAYKAVYAKYMSRDASPGVAANAAQYMFQQYFEYAALAGPNYDSLEHVQRNVVAEDLCAAGASDRSRPFGDKSGVDEPFDYWRANVLYPRTHEVFSHAFTVHFCPTTVHEPSYFQVFITNRNYNYTNKLTWNDLELIGRADADADDDDDENDSSGNTPAQLIPNDGTDENCASPFLYALSVDVPLRQNKFVLYVRWQRRDIVGEGFYNCADMVFDANSLRRISHAVKQIRNEL
nr:gp37 [Calliteara abietis nucleopolyhedrovirus]